MTPAERKLAVVLLRKAADTFSNHGCNDFYLVDEGGLTPSECEEIHAAYAVYNGEPMASANHLHQDWALMKFLARQIEGES